MNVGIIGAGLTGLTAGLELARAGHRVTLIEQEAEPGGLAGTFPFGPARLEKFYHHIFTTDLETIELIRGLGLQDRLLWRETPMGIYQGGRLRKFATPLDLLKFTPLSLANRLRFGLVILYLAKKKNWQGYERIRAAEWMRRAFGQQAWDAVWGPLLHGKFGDFAPDIGMPWFYSRVHTRAGSRAQGMTKESLGYLQGSFQVMHEALVRAIRAAGGTVRCGEKAETIVIDGKTVRGLRVSGREERFEAVLATPAPPVLLGLLPPGLAGDYWDRLRRIQYLGNVCAVLTVRRSLSPIYWMNIPDAHSPFIAVIEHTNFIPPEVYGGRRIVYLSSYLPADHPRYRAADAGLLQEYYAYLAKVIPGFTPADVEDAKIFHAAYAQPVIRAGYSANLVPAAAPIAGLYVANMAQIYPEDRGMSYSIRLGRQAAKAIRERTAGGVFA